MSFILKLKSKHYICQREILRYLKEGGLNFTFSTELYQTMVAQCLQFSLLSPISLRYASCRTIVEQIGFIGFASKHAQGGHLQPKPKPYYKKVKLCQSRNG